MIFKYNKKNPWILFFPFLIIYIILIISLSNKEFSGDEGRYYNYAVNLSHGFYTQPLPYLDLGNSPGYPLILLPFVYLKIPLIFAKLLNGILYYISLIFLFKSLELISTYKYSIILCLLWAINPVLVPDMPRLLTEVLAFSLIPIICYCTIKTYSQSSKNKYIFFTGLLIGYLALVKPIFGYVLLFMLGCSLFLLLLKRKNLFYKKSLFVFLISLIINLPYLAYTYKMTNKLFYWSSFGGNNLYWMSTPYKDEYGSWLEYPPSLQYRIPGSNEKIIERHKADFDLMLSNPEVYRSNVINGQIQDNLILGTAQDDMFKKIAIRNIEEHPFKFLRNCVSNATRMCFGFPMSYTHQNTAPLIYIIINGSIIFFFLLSFFISVKYWKNISYSLKFLFFFVLIYFGGSLFGSAETRMFVLVVPILFLWIAYVFQRMIVLKQISPPNAK